MDFLAQYGLFLAKAATVVVALLLAVAGVVALAHRARGSAPDEGQLEVRSINDRLDDHRDVLRAAILDEKSYNKLRKEERKADKKRDDEERRRVFVLDFDGDVEASALDALREEISAVLTLASTHDEVVIRLESPGGLVHSYGLAAAQLERLRDRQVRLTVCVDEVAASGGYLMACVADRILAAPFALVGSIGVIGQIPNFHRLLKKHEVDVEIHTAGEYKRTLTMFGQNTEQARDKFREELQETHDLFKAAVSRYRPDLDLHRVATGEVWYGSQAVEIGLVDEIRTSDDYLQSLCAEADLYEVSFSYRKSLPERLGLAARHGLESAVRNLLMAGSLGQWRS